MKERIQKVLAAAGRGSRREIEQWIAAGRVRVNGQVAKLGDRIDARDTVVVDNKRVQLRPGPPPGPRVVMYHKPVGEVVTRSDPEGRATAFDRLPRLRDGRWIAIGRLDLNTCGLLLFTTDGALANAMMHPSGGVVREYAVRVAGSPGDDKLKALKKGVKLDDGPARFDTLERGGGEGVNQWFHVTLREGRKREVRRLWEAVGCKVSRLIRVRYGPIRLARELARGRYRDLTAAEIAELYETAGLPVPDPAASKRPRRPLRPGKRRRR